MITLKHTTSFVAGSRSRDTDSARDVTQYVVWYPAKSTDNLVLGGR